MAYTNPKNPDCQNCNKSGLAILPARYAVVPKDIDAALPAPLGNKVTHLKLAHYKYALRTLRAGFFYLFHEKHARGSHVTWEVYGVTEAGTVWKQPSPEAMKPQTEPACSSGGHNIPASVITIESPEKCKRVWIAFSEHAWSPETLKAFAQDAALRDRRMQTFLPATWVKAGGYRHGLVATKDNIEKIIEYATDFDVASLNGREMVPTISDESGGHTAGRLAMQATRYKAVSRSGQGESLANVMLKIGENSKGQAHRPMVMAVWDAVGITQELNGYRNDAAGWIQKYAQERELEITALNAIKGVKKALETKAVENETQRQQDVRNNAPKLSATTERRARAQTLSAVERRNEIEVCDIVDYWASRDLPITSGFGGRLNAANLDKEPQRSAKIAALKAEAAQRLDARDANSPTMIKQAERFGWEKYEEKLTPNAYQNFEKKHDAFLDEAAVLIDQRTDDLIVWLKSKALFDQLIEFNQLSNDDGVIFDDQVGKMIHGINSSPNGRILIDAWVKEMKASEENLLWRSIALNQQEGITAVNELLASAGSQSVPVGALALDFIAVHVRKMADIYKKANTMQNTLIKAQNSAEGINKVKVTNFDRLFMTVGDKLFLPFIQRGFDSRAEFGVRGLMMARAGVEPNRILESLATQSKLEGKARSEIVARLRTAKTFLGTADDLKTAKYTELSKSWEKIKADPDKGPTALKENRLSYLVAILELVNLIKISWEFKDNKRTFGELGASACSTIAALSDIAANAAKHIVGDKVSKTFQYLKVSGGIFSAGAGYYFALKDFEKMAKGYERMEYGLATIYLVKGLAQGAAATSGILVALSYAAPLMEKSGMKILTFSGKYLFAQRLFFMTWAVRMNMIGLAITASVWIFTPDPLKKWCEESPFGPNKKNGPGSSKQLLNNLSGALENIS